ncbi:hypothetical protein HanRHA438_Chr13g0583931 [Helianthus annuus]|nr:hypothetical protein HanRHA438_Chr13g0583931 [Helianthus annuus]
MSRKCICLKILHTTGQESFARIHAEMVIRLCFACNLCFLLFHMPLFLVMFMLDCYHKFRKKNHCLYKDFSTLTKYTRKRIQGHVYFDTDDHTTRKIVSLYFDVTCFFILN